MLLEHDTDGSGAAVLHALGLLARAVVDELATDGTPADGGLTLVGVTGSAGKTSTKEMLRAALEGQGKVHAAEASYNNHWGVPLTLARMPADTEFAVIEIGMNHPGEIAPLARMELTESVALLFERLPGLALVGEPESRGTFVLRGHRRVEVTASGGRREERDA